MYSQIEVRKFILDEWLKNRNILFNSLAKKYKVQRFPSSLKLDQKVIRGLMQQLLREKLQGNQKCIIRDNETYCKLDCSTLPGQQFYTISKRTKPDVLLKAFKPEKFGKKFMVWQAICLYGFKTQTFFTNRNMSSKVYVKERL